MNLLDLMVTIKADDQASAQVESLSGGLKGKLSSAFETAKKVGVAALAAIGTATVGVGKAAFDAYASYEQLVGGVDTLFKSSSGKLQEYAANAYKTAGVSANQYMEQATSFAASLVTSLKGDTAAAVEYANMAIVDMSDNANKMGTDIESIQWAYQGFAKQNYTMLDNLKLGYGGTKSEMERLIADANRVKQANGEMADLSIDSFADVVEAIHIMQDEMGIAGTTAEEAASTIEGSINSMKAAWDNWLAGLGNPDADMSQLTAELVDSAETAVGNAVPAIGRIIGSLAQAVPEMLGDVGTAAGNAIKGGIEGAFGQVDFSALTDLANSAAGAVERIKQQFSDLADGFWNTFGPALEFIGQLCEDYLFPALDTLGGALEDLFDQVSNSDIDWEGIGEALGTLAGIILGVFVVALTVLSIVISAVVEVFATLNQWITDFQKGVSDAGAKVQEFVNNAGSTIQNLPAIIGGALQSAIQTVMTWGQQMVTNAQAAALGFAAGIGSGLAQVPGKVSNALNNAIQSAIRFATSFAARARSAASQFASNLMSGLASLPSRVASIGSGIINGIVSGITGGASRVVGALTGAVGNAVNSAKRLLGINSPSRVFKEMFGYVMKGAEIGIADNEGLVVGAMETAMGNVQKAAVVDADVKAAVSPGGNAVTGWLESNLPRIIARYTPVTGESALKRISRQGVAYV